MEFDRENKIIKDEARHGVWSRDDCSSTSQRSVSFKRGTQRSISSSSTPPIAVCPSARSSVSPQLAVRLEFIFRTLRACITIFLHNCSSHTFGFSFNGVLTNCDRFKTFFAILFTCTCTVLTKSVTRRTFLRSSTLCSNGQCTSHLQILSNPSTQTFRCIAPRLTRSREGRPSLELHLISADLVLFSCFFLLQRISSRSVPPRRRRCRSSAQHSATPSGFTSFFYFSNSDPPPIWTLSQAVVSLHDSKNKKKIATQLWKKSNQQTHSQQQHSFR